MTAGFITDYEAADTLVLNGFGFTNAADLSYLTIANGDLALELTATRFVVFDGITSEDEPTGGFEFG